MHTRECHTGAEELDSEGRHNDREVVVVVVVRFYAKSRREDTWGESWGGALCISTWRIDSVRIKSPPSPGGINARIKRGGAALWSLSLGSLLHPQTGLLILPK